MRTMVPTSVYMFGRSPRTVWCWDGSLPFFMTNTLVVIDPGDSNPDACQDDSQGCDNHPQPPILKVMLSCLTYHTMTMLMTIYSRC